MRDFTFSKICHRGIKTEMEGIIFQDSGECYHAYVPALGIDGYGPCHDTALRHMMSSIQSFFHDQMEKGCLRDMLSSRGWLIGEKQAWPPYCGVSLMSDVIPYMQMELPVTEMGMGFCLPAF